MVKAGLSTSHTKPEAVKDEHPCAPPAPFWGSQPGTRAVGKAPDGREDVNKALALSNLACRYLLTHGHGIEALLKVQWGVMLGQLVQFQLRTKQRITLAFPVKIPNLCKESLMVGLFP